MSNLMQEIGTKVGAEFKSHRLRMDSIDADLLIKTNANTSAISSKLNANANAVSSTKLQTARTINGVAFDGTNNITITDSTKLSLTGKATDSDKLDGLDSAKFLGVVSTANPSGGSANDIWYQY